MDESDSDSNKSESHDSDEPIEKPVQQIKTEQEQPAAAEVDSQELTANNPDTLSSDAEAFPAQPEEKPEFESRVKDFFNVASVPDSVKYKEPTPEIVLQNPYLNHLEDEKPSKGLGEHVAELAQNLTSKTAEAIAKPLLDIINPISPTTEQPG